MAVKPSEAAECADRIARLHTGLPYLAADPETRKRIWTVVTADLEERKSPCGICLQQARVDPGHAVVFQGRLRFCCGGCFARIERAIMDPPMPDRDGI